MTTNSDEHACYTAAPTGAAVHVTRIQAVSWEVYLRRWVENLQTKADQCNILRLVESALQQAAHYAGRVARQDPHAARSLDTWQPLHDATE